MPKHQLPTQRAAKVGPTSGLSPQTIQAGAGTSIATAQINPNAGQVGFQPANIPQFVQDVTAESVNQFGQTLSKAAFDFQERESTYQARLAVDAYQAKVFDTFNGYTDSKGNFVKGYSSKEGVAATGGYQEYADSLESDFYATLDGLPPSVQQKAIFEMNTVKQGLRNKAASHRITEANKLEENRKFRELQSIAGQMEHLPKNIFKPDSTGQTLFDQARSKFDSDEEFSKWWGDTIGDITANQYWTKYQNILESTKSAANPQGDANLASIQAYQQAREYATNVARPTLQLDPNSENRVLKNLETMRNDASLAKLNILKTQDLQNEAQVEKDKQGQLTNLRQLRADAMQGRPFSMTPDEFVQATTLLKNSEAVPFYNFFFKPTVTASDPVELAKFDEKARFGKLDSNDYLEIRKSGFISAPDANTLMSVDRASKNKETGATQVSMNNHVKNLFGQGKLDTLLDKLVYPYDRTALENAAKEDGVSCIQGGNKLGYCKELSTLTYGMQAGQISLNNNKPIMKNGTPERVTNREEYADMALYLANEFTEIDSRRVGRGPGYVEWLTEMAAWEQKKSFFLDWEAYLKNKEAFDEKWKNDK